MTTAFVFTLPAMYSDVILSLLSYASSVRMWIATVKRVLLPMTAHNP
jgi:hypothetical protein